MTANRFIRAPLWTTLVAALVAAMVVAFFVFVQSGEAAPQAADEQPSAPVSPRIVGGTEVNDGKYPFIAYIEIQRSDGSVAGSCSGTLIDRDSVLTAAHCLDYPAGTRRWVYVVVGRTVLSQNQGQVRFVPEAFSHPRFNANLVTYDAAVLTLESAVTGIQPIRLATANQNYLETPGRPLTVAGWGATGNAPSSDRMREVTIPIVSDSRAKQLATAEGTAAATYIPRLMIAAGKKGTGHHCLGDSGGPLFASSSRTQVGIASKGRVDLQAQQCFPPMVYTEVNNPTIRNWILAAARR
jgi:secreted trypsin-like serine protease